VAAGGKLEVPIQVTSPGSVVEYYIEIASRDLAIAISAERDEGVTVVKVSICEMPGVVNNVCVL